MLRVAYDFDSTLVVGQPLRWRLGARERLLSEKESGNYLILHSARCNPMDPSPSLADEIAGFYEFGTVNPRITDQWARFDEMRAFLQGEGVWSMFDEVWQAPGKPTADAFYDDKCEML